MKLKLNRAYGVEEGKTYEIVTVWQEDDARPSDRESIKSAWKRIVGRNLDDADRTGYSDLRDDWTAYVYRGGWVVVHSPEGSSIGVLVEVKLEGD